MSRYRTVLFDCDSTLTSLEGIDRLAGERPDLAELTAAAMDGSARLEDVYRARLELVRPGRDAVARLATEYLEHAVEDAAAVIGALSRAGIAVHVISGGVRSAVASFASALGLGADAVHAVDVQFDADGGYTGFDEASPLTRSGGKAALIRELAPRLTGPVMFVGDGVTDLEAAPVVDLFVAYAGVVERPAVSAAAQVVIRSASLAPVLPLALHPDQIALEDLNLYRKGVGLLATDVTEKRR